MGWFENVISMDGRLQGKARNDRRLIFITAAVLGCILGIISLIVPWWGQTAVVACVNVVPQFVVLALCLCRVHLTRSIVRAYIASIAMGIVGTDLHMRSVGSAPVWPTFVLLTDLSLVLGLGRRFATGLTAIAAVWIVITSSELMARVGLFDLPGSAPDWHRWDCLKESASCKHPPCPVNLLKGLTEMQSSLTVLLIDFVATRGFADSAEREKASMARTIKTVEAIAQLLAGYDVDTVAEMLQEAEAEGRLPAAMHEALHRLEQNLRAYRPYLPKSCLPAQDIVVPEDRGSFLQSSISSAPELSDSDSSDQVEASPRAVPAKVLGAMKSVRSTLLVVNTRNVLACLEQEPRTFTSFFEMLLTKTMSAVESRRGLVDVFVGDRILASFNTSRNCGMHATAAVGAAQQIVREVHSYNSQEGTSTDNHAWCVSIGAALGRVQCGDTGCAEMRRFSLLGVLPVLACGMERAARALGLDVVCNTTLQQDAEHEHVLLLVPRLVRLVKQSVCDGERLHGVLQGSDTDDSRDDGTCRVHELVVPNTVQDPCQEGEWMYHIGKAAAEWEPYNAAMRAYLSGTDIQKASEMAGDHHRQAHSTISLLGHTTPLAVHV